MGKGNEASLLVSRPRLEALLDRAFGHRLALVVADAGFGKTTLLTGWTSGINAVLHDITPADADLARFARHVVDALRLRVPDLSHDLAGTVDAGHPPDTAGEERARPDAIAELLGGSLARHVRRDVVLVLDNVHLLPDGPSLRLLAGLIRHAPPLLHVVLASRTVPPIAVDRLRDRGDVLELHGADLDFTVAEIAALASSVLGEDAAALAEPVRRATAGWPAAVRMTVEALREVDPAARADYLADLSGEDGRITRLAATIYRQEPLAVQLLLATVGLFDEATADLLEAIGVDAAAVDGLVRRGLFLEPGSSGTGWFRLHAIVAEAVAQHALLPRPEVARLRIAAAKWFVAHDRPFDALCALVAAEQQPEVVDLLTRSGQQLMQHGHSDAVVRAVASLPAGLRDGALERLAGEAYQLRGDWDNALRCYGRAAPEEGSLDPGLAWRMGLIRYLRGELDEANAVYLRGRTDGPPSRDVALLLAWKASGYWMRGDAESCGRLAVRAMHVATEVDDAQSLAAAHTVLAMLAALEGDRRANDAHYIKALQYAERAGDVLQMVRIHNNRGSRHLEEGSFPEALAELDIAIRLADLSGFAAFGALALCNRGEAQLRLGRLEQAQGDFAASIEVFERLGSALVANPLEQLGVLQALRGERVAAEQTFARAIRHAEAAGDVQAMVPALAGMARLLADTDPDPAAALAARAVHTGTGLGLVGALLAAGWVDLARGDRAGAASFARRAEETARDRRDVPGRAEAAALLASVVDDDREAVRLAETSAALWARVGDPIGQAAAAIVRAQRLEEAAARPALEAARARMRAIGCRSLDARAAAALARLEPVAATTVRIETLGGFRLVRDGQVVPASAWKSRKARELLKILVSRRGRAVTHEHLMEVLWPGEDPAGLANRFNVLVSTVRTLLDPERRLHPDGCVVNEGEALRLDLAPLEIDVECFLDDAAAGFRLLRAGRETEATERLLRAEARYAGEFLEEDVYVDWAAPLREEARMTYRHVGAGLARQARAAGDADAAVRYLLRSLERDPYDERTHLELVSVLAEFGRHGDARRCYRGYCERMEELAVEAAPFPAV